MFNLTNNPMKKLFVAAVAALAMFSCSKDTTNNDGGVEAGEPVTAVITLSQPQKAGGTRATSPVDVTRGEDKINTATVYIFNSSKALEAIANFAAADIAASFKEVNVSTGMHYFLATINTPANPALATIAVGDNLATVEQKLFTGLTDMTTIATNNNFFMTNISGSTAHTLVPGGAPGAVLPANQVVIKIGRAMAKVNANISGTVLQPNGTLKNAAAGDVEFLVSGNPNQMYFFPTFAGSQLTAPYYNAPTVIPANYFPNLTAATTYASVSTMLGNLNVPVYAMENSNDNPRTGETTYILLTGIYAPNVWYDANGALDATVAVHGNDFWRIGIKNSLGNVASFTSKIYSAQPTQAEIDLESGVVNHPDYVAVKYDGGRTYYGIWLNDPTIPIATPIAKYTVPRNNYFDITVNEINGPGANTPAAVIPDPSVPHVVNVFINAEISVEPWELISQGEIIG